MPEEWIVRVQDTEYGPVDLETLLDWKKEGRVLPSNEVRKVDDDLWTVAEQIPSLFPSGSDDARPLPFQHQRQSFSELLLNTFRIFVTGFVQFLFLTALVVIPAICGRLSSASIPASPEMTLDARTFLAGAFNLCMLLLTLAAWPAYIAGIQILTSEILAGRSLPVFELLQRALKFWPRAALLCVFVYGNYIFWTVLLFLTLAITVGSPSLFSIFVTLLALAFWIWMIGRLWVNFLFWQQFSVLSGSDFATALRQSKELARSRREPSWFQRPFGRGVFVVSLWFAVVFLLNAAEIWSLFQFYLHEVATTTDPQALMQSMSEHAKLAGFSWMSFALWLVQKMLQPLLGIAFVLLYFQGRADNETEAAARE
jgi:hypothetical protein